MQEKINAAMETFQRMDGFEKAGFTFWSFCVLCFYGLLLYIITVAGKETFQSLFKKLKTK